MLQSGVNRLMTGKLCNSYTECFHIDKHKGLKSELQGSLNSDEAKMSFIILEQEHCRPRYGHKLWDPFLWPLLGLIGDTLVKLQ